MDLNLMTLVIGASVKTQRYSNIAIRMLRRYEYPVIALGLREGWIDEVPIITSFPFESSIDTVNMYVGPQRQQEYIDKIIRLNPRRVIFNPGTENLFFYKKLNEAGIKKVEACTLVMLSTGIYSD